MKTNHIPKIILDRNFNSKGRIYRPKTRWITDVQNYLRRPVVIKWRQKTEDRVKYHPVVREVMATDYDDNSDEAYQETNKLTKKFKTKKMGVSDKIV